MVVADLLIEFRNIADSGIDFTMGSYDTAFGDQVNYVTNNAAAFKNPFLMNSLFYSTFGGEVGTLNTIGMKVSKETKTWDAAVYINNGTSEDALNVDGNFEYGVKLGYTFINTFRLAASIIKSDDRKNDIDATGFEADLTAFIFDAKIELPKNFSSESSYIKGYYGSAKWSDKTPGTNDMLQFWMIELKYFIAAKLYTAFRLSAWNPEDHNGDGIGISKALQSPSAGLAATSAASLGLTGIIADQNVMRYQAALGYTYNKGLLFKVIGFFDDYEHKTVGKVTDTLGFIIAINAAI